MRLFSKELAAGRSYTDVLQKKTNEKLAAAKQVTAGYKDVLEQYEKEFQDKLSELHQIALNMEGLKEQQEDIKLLKEKQEYVLRNFPTLEGNIVEKLKGAQSHSTEEVLNYLKAMDEKQRKRNIWTKVLLWISLVCSAASVGGVVVILLYLADYIAF